MDDSLEARLGRLYEEMWEWARQCDPLVARRRADVVDVRSRLFIVGEAPAAGQVQRSGVNWHTPAGTVGDTGRRLTPVLHAVGYTIALQTHAPHGGPNLRTAYTTDLYPCFPGARRPPRPAEVADALAHRFLEREFALLRPRVVLLLGTHSVRAFYTYVLDRTPPSRLVDFFVGLSAETPLPEYAGATVVPFLHPSGASPAYASWLRAAGADVASQPQVQAIRRALSAVP